MVWESRYWKLRLKALTSEIETLASQPDGSELDISNLEIDIFTGFFLVRKLIDSQTKLSSKIENQTVACFTSEKKSKTPKLDIINRFDIHELYDLEAFSSSKRPLRVTCNIFVHSVFLWMVYDNEGFNEDEGVVTGVHLTSDFESEKAIYWFEIAELIRVFKSVSDDELVGLQMRRDTKTGQMKVLKG